MDDVRFEWMRDKVYFALGISEPEVFEELINRDEGEFERALAKFLNETPDEGRSAAIFYKREMEEDIEVEIEVEPSEAGGSLMQEVEGGNETPHESAIPTPVVETVETPTEEKQKTGKKKKKRGKKAASARTEDSSQHEMETPREPEPLPITEGGNGLTEEPEEKVVQLKIITQTIVKTYLYMCHGHIPEEVAVDDCVYFIRNTPGMVDLPNTIDEAHEILPQFFEYGILNGHSLVMLEQIITQSLPSRRIPDQHAKVCQSHIEDDSAIEGEVRLEVPDLDTDGDENELARNEELVHDIEEACLQWTRQISSALEFQLKKTPQGKGPLPEIDFWRERNSALSALNEQLKLPNVRRMLSILSCKDALGDHAILQNFELHCSELSKYHVEAKDNVRFLSTLERHFKNVTHGAGFQIVLDTIPSMMNALRMVWIISRHYNNDDRMVPLMERIAWQLAERGHPPSNQGQDSEAKKTLELWKECYFEVRAKIEASGRDARWEFDRKRLFERTDYMATICQDIYNVAEVLEEFYNIFGPELKSVTGDPQRIEEVLKRVDGLVDPIQKVDFEPFSLKHQLQWKKHMDWFNKEVSAIEDEAKHFINESFKTLRSAEGAFDLLLKFRHIRSREAINTQMMKKFNDILLQYGKEARNKYLGVARQMKEYEDKKYDHWQEHVTAILPGLLKRNLLTKPDVIPIKGEVQGQDGKINLSNESKYVVDFASELAEIITETKYMEQLGFSIPELARNVALQEDKYIRWNDGLKHMLSRYHTVVATLSNAETQLLDEHLQDLSRTLKPGHKRLNWNSLGISDYVSKCEQAISKFESLLNQIQKNAKDIDARLKSIEGANLFKGPPPLLNGEILPSCKEYFERIEQERIHTFEVLARKYRAIGPLLTKMEGLVAHTNSGKSTRLHSYYAYWENKVYHTLRNLMITNLTRFNQNLAGMKPMFQVEAMLSAPEILLAPAATEVYKLCMQSVRDCVEGTKNFVRWMNGTCIETPPQNVEGEDEPIIFSFFSDISVDPFIIEFVNTSSNYMQKTLTNLTKYLSRWKRYRPLWKLDKTIMLEKFAAKNPTCVAFDDMLQFYSKLANEVDSQPKVRDEDSIRLHMTMLADTVRDHAKKWVNSLGTLLQEAAKTDLFGLQTELQTMSENLKRSPDTLEDLKFVLKAIADIKDMSLTVEMRIADIQERYRTIAMYNIPITDEEREACANIQQIWEDLFLESKYVDASLIVVKKKFTEITQTQIGGFSTELDKFHGRFKEEGPCAVGNDLDKGLLLLEQYKKELKQYETDRQELANAERLFDLPITMYPELVQVQKEMSGLEKIYDIYKEQKAAREEWAQTLWANLNVNHLVDGIEGYIKSLKKLPRDVKGTPTARMVEGRMKEFKDSIPLFVDLKNEALRERHWKELMQKTGKSFDMNPDTFTLENLFAMELHNYKDVIADIVTSASKELSIEKGIKEVTDVWEGMKFNVVKYMKGTQERGFILGAVDEVMQILDDNAMNLQSMSASRFVGPFLGQVQTWEKSLSLIGEVLEVWLVVQRKWMYLESIFIGGDIRSQLPEEAKKFDAIDKLFKKIMQETHGNPKIKDACHAQNRLQDLEMISTGLEKCQKSLNDYLDSKRNAFPRFFFISDDELLSILGSSEPTCVQEHMIKMFDNISSLKFQEGNNKETLATAMISAEGEAMDFRQSVAAEGRVEDWMTGVLEEMRKTNRLITKEAIFKYCQDISRVDWMYLYQGMVVLATNQVWWTWEVEDVFRMVRQGDKMAMKIYSKKMHSQIDNLVVQVRSPLSKNDRKKFNSVLIIDVHARDIIDGFVRDSILDAREFEWESQLRFYWDKEPDELNVRQCTGTFGYGYEYMGLNGRLVITPLTDRIYLTLTQVRTPGTLLNIPHSDTGKDSLKHFRIYFTLTQVRTTGTLLNIPHSDTGPVYVPRGAPAGPAGTGKTETTKDLAKALGLLCVVTNCGEGMDYMAVGKIFSGLAQCGAWGCFDEFNRIDVSVLSVISSQIQTIRNALVHKLKKFQVLAKKMTVLYKLAKEQLSKQYHYDFGLRALKSVLVMAGELKRGSADLEEDVVLMRALRDMNLPKLCSRTCLYSSASYPISSPDWIVPGCDILTSTTQWSRPYRIKPMFPWITRLAQCDAAVLTGDIVEVDKVVQMYETMLTRHTTMVVGPTGGGKTVVINTLAQAQTRLGTHTKIYIMNPKAMSVIELYGILDPATRDWTDGLLSNIFREINRPTDKNERKYILFDGDVDALWVENMNSVMDDNRLLTLANGERIRLQKHCALLFEVSDLQYASPATVSRCGMVFVDPKNLGYLPYWQKWVNGRSNKNEHTELSRLFEKYVPGVLDMVIEGIVDGKQGEKMKTIVPQTALNLVVQLSRMLEALLNKENLDISLLECFFLESLYCSIGASLLEDGRVKFDDYIKSVACMPLVTDENQRAGPGNSRSTGYLWVPWSEHVPKYIHDPDKRFNEILVPTKDTVRNTWLLDQMVKIKQPILFVGDSGTSKTATIQDFLRNINQEAHLILAINFSSRTTSMDVQRNLEANVEKRTKDTYGPPPGKRLLVFMDDMNMPQVDEYGTQQPIALLKLLLEKGGMYDRGKDLILKYIRDIGFLASMGKAGGGRNEVDPRPIESLPGSPPHHPRQVPKGRGVLPSLAQRVLEGFYDRLINAEDKVHVQQLIKTVLEDHFKDDTEEVLREPVLFGDYRTALDEGEPRLYEDIQDYDACKALFQEILEEYKTATLR
ncbi:putative dynein heavy chain 10, axonemal isoform X3 [Apostichopus japonicus]|uniref:Putative dynein heavy chain 10, axonemal isoform X3 n=1 Tax=Stichopus japonicus TaxID=307972 RepID=A0A2G8KKP8_STIJA|nr:putative dynein heavy chain 10, axonemal isoform X3 [Apostichopus japonicus]